jgi:Glycosyl transferase family 11
MDLPKRRLVVPIEGGLGAQILGVVLVDSLRERSRKNNIEEPFVDLSYFSISPDAFPGLSIYGWQLNYYGIARSEFENVPPPRKKSRIRRLFGSGPKWLIDGSIERQEILMTALTETGSRIVSRFPISEAHMEKTSEFLLDIGPDHCVVHLRRGDYLNVASHVVADQDLLPIVRRLIQTGIRSFLFISDSAVDLEFFRSHLPSAIRLEYIVGGDLYFSHALMRRAKVLVTSNSQFSLSAALLNPQGFRLMPKVWFSGRHANLNEYLPKLSDWLIIK